MNHATLASFSSFSKSHTVSPLMSAACVRLTSGEPSFTVLSRLNSVSFSAMFVCAFAAIDTKEAKTKTNTFTGAPIDYENQSLLTMMPDMNNQKAFAL